MERQFQERIARAKEAARLASIAALARGSSADTSAPPRGPPPPGPPANPPPRIPDDAVRLRIDRLVAFITRNGPAFEATVREREAGNPDFAFLQPGTPSHDYFVWKKSQESAVGQARQVPRAEPLPPLRPLAPGGLEDPMLQLPVGAMANACKAARARGLPAYTPVPPDLLAASASTVAPVEPARLEARLAEFYRTM